MAHLTFPLTRYRENSYQFGEDIRYDGARWGIHLGEDVRRRAGTPVRSIGDGRVVYSRFHPGQPERRNWGNILIIEHIDRQSKKNFYAVYAHMYKIAVSEGDLVSQRQLIGHIARANSAENGWWPEEHLHFGIYVGPWHGSVLPGYYREDQHLTELRFWHAPSTFIRARQHRR